MIPRHRPACRISGKRRRPPPPDTGIPRADGRRCHRQLELPWTRGSRRIRSTVPVDPVLDMPGILGADIRLKWLARADLPWRSELEGRLTPDIDAEHAHPNW